MNTKPESFDNLRNVIHERYDGLSPHLQRIARFALEDPNTFALETVVALAERNEVQPSTLVRFAKTFGYAGFSDLQKVFRLRLIEGAPAFRNKAEAQAGKLEKAAHDNPLAILQEFTEASILELENLRETVDGDKLKAAIEMMDKASNIFVIGQRRAFPVAAYISYGLIRLETRCQLLDAVGGMVPQQAATMTPDDLLIAVSFAEYAQPVVEVVKDTHIRGIPILAITDRLTSPLAKNSTLCFPVDDADVHRFRPLAATMALAQTLIIALGYYHDATAKPRRRKGKSKTGT